MAIVWLCISRIENTRLFCDACTAQEIQIERVLVAAINQTWCDKDTFLAALLPFDIQRTAVLKTAVHWLEQYSDTTNYPTSNGFFPACTAGKFQGCLLVIPYGLCPRSVYDKGG